MAQGVKKINEWIMKDGRALIVTIDVDPNKLSAGTQFIDPKTGVLKYIKVDSVGRKTWEKFAPSTIFDPNSITTSLLANDSVTGEKMANRSITSSKIKEGNVTNIEIGDQQVFDRNIKDQNVTKNKIKDKAIDSTKIEDYSIRAINLAEPCINSEKLFPRSVQENHIVLKNLTKNVIANKTLTNAEIADLTIIESLIANNAVSNLKISDSAVTETKIAIDSIKENHIKNNAITSSKIKDDTITSSKILELDGAKLVNNSITEVKFKDNSVSSRAILNGSVTYDKLSSGLKDSIDRSVKLEGQFTESSVIYQNTAWVKGGLLIKSATPGTANLTVSGNITASGTITATKVYNPVYADLAEAYVPTEEVQAGDAVCLSLEGNLKVEKLTESNSNRFIGFVSDQYATIFGATLKELETKKKVAVTLVGRIKIKAQGQANIGDYVYVSNGEIKFCKDRTVNVIGRVLENKNITDSFVLCQLWP